MRLYQLADRVECRCDILNTCLSGWALAIVVVDFVSRDNLSPLSVVELVVLFFKLLRMEQGQCRGFTA